MKKRAFPKELKFGTYLPIGSSIRLIKIADAIAALSRFIGEYFDGIAKISTNLRVSANDSVYLNGEHTAYLFRCITEAIYNEAMIDISVSNSENEFSICFSTQGASKASDISTYEKLLDAARLSGFSVSFVGRAIVLRTALVHGMLVVSTLSIKSFYDSLTYIFFGNQPEDSEPTE